MVCSIKEASLKSREEEREGLKLVRELTSGRPSQAHILAGCCGDCQGGTSPSNEGEPDGEGDKYLGVKLSHGLEVMFRREFAGGT